MQKLKLEGQQIEKVVAVPVLDRQNGLPVAVISLYNPTNADADTLMDVSQLISHQLFTLDSMQGTLANSDLMEKAFDLVNDGVLFLNTNQEVTKMNKSAEILFNMTSHLAMGRSITDMLNSCKGTHLNAVIRDLTTKSHAM